MWVETVTEGGLRFTVAWTKDEVDAARHRQEREATRLEFFLSYTEAYNLRSDTNWPIRRAESVIFVLFVVLALCFILLYFLGTSSMRGRGGCTARLSVLFFFPVQQTTSGIGYRQFFGFATKPLHVISNNNNNSHFYAISRPSNIRAYTNGNKVKYLHK